MQNSEMDKLTMSEFDKGGLTPVYPLLKYPLFSQNSYIYHGVGIRCLQPEPTAILFVRVPTQAEEPTMISLVISEPEAAAAAAFIEASAVKALIESDLANRSQENMRRRSADELDEWRVRTKDIVPSP